MSSNYDWIESLSCNYKEYVAPFVVSEDKEYLKSLKEKLSHLIKVLETAKANKQYIQTAKTYTTAIIKAMDDYYKGDIYQAQKEIDTLIIDCLTSNIAVSNINDSIAFKGNQDTEVQFFRARQSDSIDDFSSKEMLHIPFDKRHLVSSTRFSIPGLPCLYLGNTSYVCWLELDKPADHRFNVSPVKLDNTQKVFNLAVSIGDFLGFVETQASNNEINDYLKLLILMIATSYRVKQTNRNFKSEYVIPQLIMLSCKAHNLDGITYFSKRVSEDIFATTVGVNLALFATYTEGNNHSVICDHIRITDSFNFAMFKQLLPSLKYNNYNLRIDTSPYITTIGSFSRQFPYKETEFYEFDKYLFANWDQI